MIQSSDTKTGSIEQTIQFLHDAPFKTLEKVASNPNSKEYVLDYLSKHPDFRIRYAVARNKNAGIVLFEILSCDEDWVVRYGVARNESTPESILEKLYYFDLEDRVKKIALENPNIPHNIWLCAYNDYDPGLHSAASLNPKLARRD